MVVAYDMSWLSRKIIGALLRVDTVTLVNLVSETRAVPEFLGPACQPEPIAEALSRLLSDEAARAGQLDAMTATMLKLGRGQEPPGRRAARAVLRVLA
jgi:lipid-A-disaccharide synthase